jgi:hypothetical protein
LYNEDEIEDLDKKEEFEAESNNINLKYQDDQFINNEFQIKIEDDFINDQYENINLNLHNDNNDL